MHNLQKLNAFVILIILMNSIIGLNKNFNFMIQLKMFLHSKVLLKAKSSQKCT